MREQIQRIRGGNMKRPLTGALRRAMLMVAGFATAAVLAVGLASPASAYGGGAGHDMWQVGISGNCNNPSFCGADGLGGFWGWVEFDRFADGTITGDAQFTDCHHFIGPLAGWRSAHAYSSAERPHMSEPCPDRHRGD